MSKGIVLSLCDVTGVMVQPWLEAGYECHLVDTQHPHGVNWGWDFGANGGALCRIGDDVRSYAENFAGFDNYAIVFAFPPCTHLANSGNKYKQDKGLEALYEALGLVIACKRICEASGAPWMLENPVGSLSTYWREPDFTFHPWEYTTPKEKKRTCLWAGNNFVIPQREVLEEPPDVKESCWKAPPSPDRAAKRSVTPEGFARAVFQANEPWVRERVA